MTGTTAQTAARRWMLTMDKKRYIEVETAYSIAKKVVDAIANGEYHAGVFAYDIMDWIDELPTADVRWLEQSG